MKCKHCGCEFTPTKQHKKFCSVDCRRDYFKLGTPLNQQLKTCPACGKSFTPKSGQQKFCSDACKRKIKNQRIKSSRRRFRDCILCGQKFLPRSSDSPQKFCSRDCCLEFWEERAVKPKQKKTLEEWLREADACNMSYGNYRAQVLVFGKTFEELKANADNNFQTAHAHTPRQSYREFL